jgi:Ca2+-binding EF-hand superfamily protein
MPRAGADAIAPKVRRYAEHLLHRYDNNGDGRLQPDEWSKMHGKPEAADGNRDRVITLDELTKHIAAFGQNRRVRLENPSSGWGTIPVSGVDTPAREGPASEGLPSNGPEDLGKTPASDAMLEPGSGTQPRPGTTFHVPKSRRPAGLPDWFLRRDANGDGQLSLSEFASHATQTDLEEFARYDKNGDGFVTARECLDTLKPAKSASGKSAGAAVGKTREKDDAKVSRKR